MKNCKGCGETKSLNEFHKYKSTSDGLQHKCKTCVKQYHLDNAKSIKANRKQYNITNKESIKVYNKAYNSTNKKAKKQYYKDNKEAIKAYSLAKKDGYHSVYLLPKHNYVGITDNVYYRMSLHKNKGKDTTGFRILEKFKDRKLGLELESQLHLIGYKGGNKNH